MSPLQKELLSRIHRAAETALLKFDSVIKRGDAQEIETLLHDIRSNVESIEAEEEQK